MDRQKRINKQTNKKTIDTTKKVKKNEQIDDEHNNNNNNKTRKTGHPIRNKTKMREELGGNRIAKKSRHFCV